MAGSMSSFHYAFDDMFKMMVFLYVEPDIRIQRVHKRAIWNMRKNKMCISEKRIWNFRKHL